MLSAIGRLTAQRLGARVSQSVPKLQRVTLIAKASAAPTRDQFSRIEGREYATEAQATKTTKSNPQSKNALATKKASTTKKTTTKTTKTAAKSVKKPAKKPAKKPVKKAAKKPKAKKVLTEKQIETAAKRKTSALLKELKATALINEEPKASLPSTVWLVVSSELHKSEKRTKGNGNGENSAEFTSIAREAAQKYKNLSASELEHYNHVANENKIKNASAYKTWLHSHSPEEIRVANIARARLIRLNKGGVTSSKVSKINDDRLLKRPPPAFLLFTQDRWASGDFKNVAAQEAAKLISAEWKKLSSSERESYNSKAEGAKKTYAREYLDLYNHPPPTAATAA